MDDIAIVAIVLGVVLFVWVVLFVLTARRSKEQTYPWVYGRAPAPYRRGQ